METEVCSHYPQVTQGFTRTPPLVGTIEPRGQTEPSASPRSDTSLGITRLTIHSEIEREVATRNWTAPPEPQHSLSQEYTRVPCSLQSHGPPRSPPLTNMRMVLARILVLALVLVFSSLVAATSFTGRSDNIRKSDPNAVGGIDSQCHQTSPAEATGLTYKTCAARSGGGTENFEWGGFAQSFASWLLPWFALATQLPFGSRNYIRDFALG